MTRMNFNEYMRRRQSRYKDPDEARRHGVNLRKEADKANVVTQAKRAVPTNGGCLSSFNSYVRQWPTMEDSAYSGLAEQVVDLISPESESSPVALLLNFLTA